MLDKISRYLEVRWGCDMRKQARLSKVPYNFNTLTDITDSQRGQYSKYTMGKNLVALETLSLIILTVI